jgi:hypothetical protein
MGKDSSDVFNDWELAGFAQRHLDLPGTLPQSVDRIPALSRACLNH